MMHNTETKSGSTETTMGPLSVDAAQPAWMTLNDARERSFTGELVFEGEPDVLAYLDHGVVYYAEVANGPSLGQRLLDAGLIDAGQLERGMVRVGDIEHLGRLFDRDPSIERDAVLVLTETFTEEVVTRLANDATTTVRVTAYRHHPSGLHRWFVAPVDASTAPRPVGVVPPLGTAVVDDLPGMGRSVDDLVEELTIEWDEPFDGADEIEVLPAVDIVDEGIVEELTLESEAEAEFAPEATADHDVVDDEAVVLEMIGDVETDHAIDDLEVVDDDDATDDELSLAAELDTDEEFDVIWPNGSLEVATEDSADVDDESDEMIVELDADEGFDVIWPNGSVEVATEDSADVDEESDEMIVELDAEMGEGDVETVAADAGPDDVHVDLPELMVDDVEDIVTVDVIEDVEDDVIEDVEDIVIEDDVIEDVEDDVADAVRRALAAIETASVASPADDPSAPDASAPVHVDQSPTTQVDTDPVPAGDAEPAVAAVPLSAFAPPTPEMSAEAIYARATEQAPTVEQPALPTATSAGTDTDDATNDRSSALRRLIRSLGRKER